MAKKAAKTLAALNTAKLNQMLMVALAIHSTFLILRVGVFRTSFTRSSLVRYILFSLPSCMIQFWFERMGRPVYTHSSDGTPELKRSGEDLEAKGLTEYMWDVLYWTYGCLVLVALVGDWAWWAWAVIPVYSAWLAYSTFMGARQGMAGLAGDNTSGASGASKRQQKLEKRGGQRMAYR